MEEQKSFKTRVKEEVIANAKMFKDNFVDCEYLVCSDAFVKNPYYIIGAHTSNYAHLTGVSLNIPPEDFFWKCFNGTLQESDFSFIKKSQTEAEVRGSVRRKINALPNLDSIFENETLVEEDFVKNRVRCAFAAGKTSCTLGFAKSVPSKPQSLMKGNQLNPSAAKALEVVLRRKRGDETFDEVVRGEKDALIKFSDSIDALLSDRLRNQIQSEKILKQKIRLMSNIKGK